MKSKIFTWVPTTKVIRHSKIKILLKANRQNDQMRRNFQIHRRKIHLIAQIYHLHKFIEIIKSDHPVINYRKWFLQIIR